jgi:hypothetical protein
MTSLVQWFNRSSEYEIDGLSVRQKSRGSKREMYVMRWDINAQIWH